MFHDPIDTARAEPLDLTPYQTVAEAAARHAAHPMSRPAPRGGLYKLVLHARRPEVQRRLEVAMLVAAGLLVALIASGYLRAALGHRL